MKLQLGRAKKRLRHHLAGGWTRAVYAAPERDGEAVEPRVVEGPGLGDADDEAFAARIDDAFAQLMEEAHQAAQDGLVKQTFVLDERRSVRLDARHGRPRLRERDDASFDKTMGGKQRALRPDESAALLRAIGIMNPDGSISARHAKKYKQVNHLVELCRPVWKRVLEHRTVDQDAPLTVVDLACGNSYLDFVLAEALRLEGIPVRFWGVDVREDLIERSRARARELGLESIMHFGTGTIEEEGAAQLEQLEQLGGVLDLVVALHACDTATDEALALAIGVGANNILVAPCCQAELARQLEALNSKDSPAQIESLRKHGLLRRAYAETLTDALRVETLEACGYSVSLLEFVASEHTPKNLLIRAHRKHPESTADPARFRLDAVAQRCAALHVRPRLLELLGTR